MVSGRFYAPPSLEAVLASLAALSSRLEETIEKLGEPYGHQVAYDKSTLEPLAVVLDLSGSRGKSQVEVWVKSSDAADFYVEGSRDRVNWRQVDVISLAGADEGHEGYLNAYPYIRVRTDAANTSEIEIVASR